MLTPEELELTRRITAVEAGEAEARLTAVDWLALAATAAIAPVVLLLVGWGR